MSQHGFQRHVFFLWRFLMKGIHLWLEHILHMFIIFLPGILAESLLGITGSASRDLKPGSELICLAVFLLHKATTGATSATNLLHWKCSWINASNVALVSLCTLLRVSASGAQKQKNNTVVLFWDHILKQKTQRTKHTGTPKTVQIQNAVWNSFPSYDRSYGWHHEGEGRGARNLLYSGLTFKVFENRLLAKTETRYRPGDIWREARKTMFSFKSYFKYLIALII